MRGGLCRRFDGGGAAFDSQALDAKALNSRVDLLQVSES